MWHCSRLYSNFCDMAWIGTYLIITLCDDTIAIGISASYKCVNVFNHELSLHLRNKFPFRPVDRTLDDIGTDTWIFMWFP